MAACRPPRIAPGTAAFQVWRQPGCPIVGAPQHVCFDGFLITYQCNKISRVLAYYAFCCISLCCQGTSRTPPCQMVEPLPVGLAAHSKDSKRIGGDLLHPWGATTSTSRDFNSLKLKLVRIGWLASLCFQPLKFQSTNGNRIGVNLTHPRILGIGKFSPERLIKLLFYTKNLAGSSLMSHKHMACAQVGSICFNHGMSGPSFCVSCWF